MTHAAAIPPLPEADGPVPPGTVALVGAGPGDPDLLTLRAAECLRRAEVILHDALIPEEILALAASGAERVPVGKRAGRPSVPQALTNRLMVAAARRGRRVVRLKGGDPFVFGRGAEEAAHLDDHGIPVVVVPGITAAVGCAAAARIPLTHRGVARGLRLVTATCRNDAETAARDWAALACAETTLAVYMGRNGLRRIGDGLMAGGLDPATPSVAIENGTRPGARACFARLAELTARCRAELGDGPVVVLVGAAVAEAPGWMRRAVDGSAPVREAS